MIAVHLDTYEVVNDEPIFLGVFSSYQKAKEGIVDYLQKLNFLVLHIEEDVIKIKVSVNNGRQIKFTTEQIELDKVIL